MESKIKFAVKLFLSFFLFSSLAYASDALYPPSQQPSAATVAIKQETFMDQISGFARSFKENDGYLDFGLRTGYIYGQNSYELNHHVSELEFPFRTYMGGGNLNLGYKDLSINSEFWGSIIDDPSAGWHTKDKDWQYAGASEDSDTKSYSDSNAVIWDANMRYNFFRYSFGQKKAYGEKRGLDNIKLGLMLGYRFERFGYKDYGLYQTGTGDGDYGDGYLVSEYKIKYRLPYYGMAIDIGNEKFAALVNLKYAFSPHARDYDNHLLRDLQFYGDYKKHPNVFMANLVLSWKFFKNWNASLGADAALIRMNGTTWAENGDPTHESDQNIDTQQFIYWMGLGYRF